MKTRFLITIFLCAALAFMGCAGTPDVPEGRFLIEGKVKEVPEGTVVSLFRLEKGRFAKVTSDTLKDGRFALEGKEEGKVARRYLLMPAGKDFPRQGLDLWLASGAYVKVSGEGLLYPFWKVESTVPEQAAEAAFKTLCTEQRQHSLQSKMEEDRLYRSIKASKDEEFVRTVEHRMDSLCNLFIALDSVVFVAELEYMKQAPVSPVWLEKYTFYASFLLHNPEFGHRELIRSLYGRMSDADKATEAGQIITEYMNLPERVSVGDDMADADLYDPEGRVRHLAEFKGKYILMDFWSRTCMPCRMSFPELEEVAARYRDRLEVVSINQDTKENWLEFIGREKMKGNQWNELRKSDTGLAAAYGVNGIPHYVMISPAGKVLQIWSGYAKGTLKARVARLLE